MKGIKYKFHDIELMKLENLEPWYIRMNPKGLVPTLKHGHSVIPESDEILKFLDVHFSELTKLLLFETAGRIFVVVF